MVGQVAGGGVGNTAGQERRCEDDLAVVLVTVAVVDAVGEAAGVGARGRRRRLAEGLRVDDGLEADDFGERGRVQPGGRDDVGAALFLEEQGQPERQLGALRRFEGRGFALGK